MNTYVRRIVVTQLWLTLGVQLVGCQAISGLSSLEAANGRDDSDSSTNRSRPEEDGSVAGTGGDPMSPPEMAGTGGMAGNDGNSIPLGGAAGVPVPPCDIPPNGECNLVEGCGCATDRHCQARGSEAKPTCVPRGPKLIGELCRSPDDCYEGACDHGVCTSYCRDSNCDAGKCLPARGPDDKPLANVNVCWMSCQIKDPKSCPEGTACQLKGDAAFCIPPADPCPTLEDGNCDEPNVCAAGTDTADCSCNPSIERGTCDLTVQCGCPKGEACMALGPALDTPMCGTAGTREIGQTCAKETDCVAGAGCYGKLCKPYCNEQQPCKDGDMCRSTYSGAVEVPSIKVCLGTCNPSAPTDCKEGTVCVSIDLVAVCIWCEKELPDAKCNLVRNCGCEGIPGTGCGVSVEDDGTFSAACFPRSNVATEDSACQLNSDCGPGLSCVGHVCKEYCASDDDCDDGVCAAVWIDGKPTGIGACHSSCTPNTTGVCRAGTSCGTTQMSRLRKPGDVPSQAENVTTCLHVPLTTTCPTTNGVCDEPDGTGLCAAGADAAECM